MEKFATKVALWALRLALRILVRLPTAHREDKETRRMMLASLQDMIGYWR